VTLEVLMDACTDLMTLTLLPPANTPDILGSTPLELACTSGSTRGSLQAAMSLLDRGVRTNVLDQVGNTVLHRCATLGLTEAVSLLMAHAPFLLRMKNDKGYTPLDAAKEMKQWTCVHMLEKAEMRDKKAGGDTGGVQSLGDGSIVRHNEPAEQQLVYQNFCMLNCEHIGVNVIECLWSTYVQRVPRFLQITSVSGWGWRVGVELGWECVRVGTRG
jgi:hypothetical protein